MSNDISCQWAGRKSVYLHEVVVLDDLNKDHS